MTFTGAEVTENDLQEFMVRAICHVFIDALPATALEEIAECIVDNYNRHVLRPWRMAALPAAPSQRLQGRLGPVKQRPAFHMGDE
jgi:hypothetical protein